MPKEPMRAPQCSAPDRNRPFSPQFGTFDAFKAIKGPELVRIPIPCDTIQRNVEKTTYSVLRIIQRKSWVSSTGPRCRKYITQRNPT